MKSCCVISIDADNIARSTVPHSRCTLHLENPGKQLARISLHLHTSAYYTVGSEWQIRCRRIVFPLSLAFYSNHEKLSLLYASVMFVSSTRTRERRPIECHVKYVCVSVTGNIEITANARTLPGWFRCHASGFYIAYRRQVPGKELGIQVPLLPATSLRARLAFAIFAARCAICAVARRNTRRSGKKVIVCMILKVWRVCVCVCACRVVVDRNLKNSIICLNLNHSYWRIVCVFV